MKLAKTLAVIGALFAFNLAHAKQGEVRKGNEGATVCPNLLNADFNKETEEAAARRTVDAALGTGKSSGSSKGSNGGSKAERG